MSNTLSVAEHFPPGTKVAVVPRAGDTEPRNGRGATKHVTVAKDGSVKADGLVEFGQYWLTDGERSVAINVPGKLKAEPGTQAALAEEQELRNEAAAKVRDGHPHLGEPLLQPDDETLRDDVPASNFEKGTEPEPSPAAKFVDMPEGTPQRQGADFGTAYPVDPDEIQPQPAKQDVKKGTPQRDGAEGGYATPVDPGEVQPAKKFEDEKGPQRQGADTGTAYPVAQGSKKEQELAKSSSVSKAKGATKAVAGSDKVPSKKPARKAAAKKTTAKKGGKR